MAAPKPPAAPKPVVTDRPSGAPERIAKLLARAGVASRREVERMIEEGRVSLDGEVLATPAVTLSSLRGVAVDGRPVAAAAPARLFLYHKPAGLLVTERDPRGRPTIYDRLPADLPRVMPVGRLDLNTEGLLLLTTDGELKRRLELPSTGVERAYRARAYGHVTQPQLESLIEGVEVDGVRYGPIDANMERRTGTNAWIEMILTEGKNREVRRVLEYLGLEVSRLIRTRYGPFVLADMPPGAVGEARADDLAAFVRSLDRGRPLTDPVRLRTPPPAPRARPAESVGGTADRPDARSRPARPEGRSTAPRPSGEPAGPGRKAAAPAGDKARARPAAGRRPAADASPAPDNARARRAAAFRTARGEGAGARHIAADAWPAEDRGRHAYPGDATDRRPSRVASARRRSSDDERAARGPDWERSAAPRADDGRRARGGEAVRREGARDGSAVRDSDRGRNAAPRGGGGGGRRARGDETGSDDRSSRIGGRGRSADARDRAPGKGGAPAGGGRSGASAAARRPSGDGPPPARGRGARAGAPNAVSRGSTSRPPSKSPPRPPRGSAPGGSPRKGR